MREEIKKLCDLELKRPKSKNQRDADKKTDLFKKELDKVGATEKEKQECWDYLIDAED